MVLERLEEADTIRRSGIFDEHFYLRNYQDVKDAGIDPVLHYLDFGAKESRNPSGSFSTSKYLEHYPDVADAGINPLVHFIKSGLAEGRVAIAVEECIPVDDIVSARWAALRPLRLFAIPGEFRRISIVTDSLGKSSLFGGVGTSIIFGTLLANRLGASVRIITRTEATDGSPVSAVLAANGIHLDSTLETAFAPHIGGQDLPTYRNEIFLGTSWWTTRALLESVARPQIVYLLQEDERMFYPAGDDRLRCSETLSETGIRIVVNTELLFNYLTSGPDHLANLQEHGLWFEPAFPIPRPVQPKISGEKRRFFFYARPLNLRNLFWRGFEAISDAIETDLLDASEWEFHFVGKDIPRISLPRGVIPVFSEGLGWDDYVRLVRSMDAGLCLMDSPHPSYPPLDLAAAGAVVLTNSSSGKFALSKYSSNILVAPPTKEGLRIGFERLMKLARNDQMRFLHCSEDKIQRDWTVAFSPTIETLVPILCSSLGLENASKTDVRPLN